MSIFQFFRILWAHRLLILASTVLCFAVATAAVLIIPPKYEAKSRVILEVIKPDPVTGQVIASAYLRAYTKTQIEMIKDEQVARKVVAALNWAKDVKMQAAYRGRTGDLDLDFNAWAARRVAEGTDATVLVGSNILEISYSSDSPTRSKQVADALLKAYMDLTLESRRETARKNAEWYEGQAEKAKTILYTGENNKAQYERENGIVLQDDKTDLDTARLRALAGQGAAPVISAPPAISQAETILMSLDAEIAEASKTLGPNHPQLIQMKARRTLLAQQAAQEKNYAGASAGVAANAARANAGLLAEQKAKVMGQREKVERLRLMQDEIEMRRNQYKQAVARAAQLRQEADIADPGVTPLASAVTPQAPVFPNKALFMGVSAPAGAALGILLALLLELVSRRVRSLDDLRATVDAPVLAVISSSVRGDKRTKSARPPRPSLPVRNRVARA